MRTNSKTALVVKLFLAVFVYLAISFAFSGTKANAQIQSPSQPAQKLTFDVASIKTWQPNQPLPRIVTGIRFSTGSVYATCVTLNSLVHYAYHLTVAAPVRGLPVWAQVPCGPDTFSVEGTMPPETHRTSRAK